MRRNLWLLLLVSVVLCGGCATTALKILPEATSDMAGQVLASFPENSLAPSLWPYGSSLFLLDKNGAIVELDTQSRSICRVFYSHCALAPVSYCFGSYLYCFSADCSTLLMLSLDDMQLVAKRERFQWQRLLWGDRQCLVYAEQNQIHIFDWQKQLDRVIAIPDLGDIFNCEAIGTQLTILTQRALVELDLRTGNYQQYPFTQRACSEFGRSAEMIYFGTSARRLVAYSLRHHAISWSLQLLALLRQKPLLSNHKIVVTPDDNTIFMYTPGGTIWWWKTLGGYRQTPAVQLKENIAVLVEDSSKHFCVQFYNTKTRSLHTNTLPQLDAQQAATILPSLYLLGGKEIEFADDSDLNIVWQDVVQFGNRVDVEFLSEPKGILMLNKAAQLFFSLVNLSHPTLDITIVDPQGMVVLQKTIARRSMAGMIFKPQKIGMYQLQCRVHASNSECLKNYLLPVVTQDDYWAFARFLWRALQGKVYDGEPKISPAACARFMWCVLQGKMYDGEPAPDPAACARFMWRVLQGVLYDK